MKQLIYALQFRGSGTPENAEGTVLKATTKAPSSDITSIVGPQGLESRIEAVSGTDAEFTSEVRVLSASSFTESGHIDFGTGAGFDFETVGEGYLGASPEEGVNHGSVIWRVTGGTGQFEGAQGLITSNFTLSAGGEVTDNQFGVLYVR
jgi:hypothetical protein